MEAEPPKRNRRWFQFSLRSLMIVVTLFCVVVGGYVGWQAKVVRERRAELSRVVEMRLVGIDGADIEGGIPWIRCALGVKRVGSIKMLVGTDAAGVNDQIDAAKDARAGSTGNPQPRNQCSPPIV
jgi:hypothetical protein